MPRTWKYSLPAQLTVTTAFQVSANLGSVNVQDGLELVEPSNGTGDTTPMTLGSRDCLRNLDPGHDAGQDYRIYFRVDNQWADGRRNLTITVDYFDTGSAEQISLHYLSTTGVKEHGTAIQLAGGSEPYGVWRTMTWALSDAMFESDTLTHSVNFWLEPNMTGLAERRWLAVDTVTLE